MYWRLLTSNPTAAREIVLSEKPVISTETDRMDKGMLDQVCLRRAADCAGTQRPDASLQLLLHTGTLSSIYHKNPNVCLQPYDLSTLARRLTHTARRSSVRPSQSTCPIRQLSTLPLDVISSRPAEVV